MTRDVHETILKLTDLRVEALSGAVLVDNVSLELKRGEVMGLIGESGAGKSTIGLASMVYARAGCRITGGKVEIQGEDVRALDAEGRRQRRGQRIAYIAQSAAASFNPAHRLMDQVTEMPISHGLMTQAEAQAWALELFRALDLPNPDTFGDRYPHQVSGGQLQRAMAAMAMSCRPDILVLDEPTTALDVTTQIEVLALLKKLIRDYNMAALYISHDLAVVAQVADRVMVLRHGKMVELGETGQILLEPRMEYTKALVAERKAADKLAMVTTTTREKPVLEGMDVTGIYGTFRAVKNVSIAVARGETVAVVGESGSGKSSLARLLVGLLPCVTGEVKLHGEMLPPALKDRNRDTLRKVQLIYQQPDVALNPRQTIGEIIGRPVAFYFNRSPSEVKARVAEWLRLVGEGLYAGLGRGWLGGLASHLSLLPLQPLPRPQPHGGHPVSPLLPLAPPPPCPLPCRPLRRSLASPGTARRSGGSGLTATIALKPPASPRRSSPRRRSQFGRRSRVSGCPCELACLAGWSACSSPAYCC